MKRLFWAGLVAGAILLAGCSDTPRPKAANGDARATTLPSAPLATASGPADAAVSINLDQPAQPFNGTLNVGAGVDGMDEASIKHVWTPQHIASMKAPGFGSLAYRLRTELGSAAWHWNAAGTWSDAGGRQGYWISSDEMPDVEPDMSYGYDLPRRGNTHDQANDAGYSRLTDGSLAAGWKSNPYLDPHFTKTAAMEPQWLMFSFPVKEVSIDTLKIAWGVPYASRISVQYWVGDPGSNPISTPHSEAEQWKDFPKSSFTGSGGVQTVRLASAPIDLKYVRVQLTGSSATAPKGSTDVRDKLGFAVREVSLGRSKANGFVDVVKHEPSQKQTVMNTSSTDPWHRAQDINRDYAQVGLKRVFDSGLTNGEPLMMPVPALYGVPEDAAALVRYMKAQRYPLTEVEIGEEPDGQAMQAPDYAALYSQVADAISAVDPSIQLGGPGYQSAVDDWYTWPSRTDSSISYTGRFVSALRALGHLDKLDFFSFEWYPFDDVCVSTTKAMKDNPDLLTKIMATQLQAGLPADVPMIITEYGYSSFAGRAEVEMPGAIVDAETAAKFLELGGQTSYFYGLEPNWVITEGNSCNSWGNLMLFQMDNQGGENRPLAPFYAMELVNKQWIQPGSGSHIMFPSTYDGGKSEPAVTTYALRRPDGRMSVMLFNKDPSRAVSVRLETVTDGRRARLADKLDLFQYSAKQFVWDPENPTPGADNPGRPKRNLPPTRQLVASGQETVVTLPPTSISVLRTQ